MRFMRCPNCGNIVEQKFNMKILGYENLKCQNCKSEMYEISRDDMWAFKEKCHK